MKYWLIITSFLVFGCQNNKPNNQFTSTSKGLIAVWKIDSLSVPKCGLCSQLRWKLNYLFGIEVEVGDELVFSAGKLKFVSNTDTVFQSNYRIVNSRLERYGSDWFDDAKILKMDSKRMILSCDQHVASMDGEEPPESEPQLARV